MTRADTDVRLSLEFTPADRLTITLGYDFQNYESPEYANFAAIDQEGDLRKNVNMNYPGEADKDADGGYLKAVYHMDEMQLISVTSARNESNIMSYDTDFTSYDMMTMTLDREVTSLSQEFRLVSDDKNASFQWLFGVLLLSEQDDRKYDIWMNFMTMGMGMPGETLTQESDTDTTGTAAFGQISYEFKNNINICLGLRYDYEEKEFHFTQTPGGSVLAMMGYGAQSGEADESFDVWLPRAVVSYRAWEHVMPYASVSRGFRSGGFNDSESLGSSYAPEFTWNYELGAKTSWFENRLQLNAALFYIDWSDMQVEITNDGGTTVYIDNAAKATSKGAELELTARPLAGLELMAGAALTHAEYDDYTQGTQVYDGKKVIDSPEYTLNFGATYRMKNGVFVHAGYTHLGEIHHDLANTHSQENYGLVDAKIGYETERFDIYVYGKNLFDEEYVTRAGEVNGTWYGRAGAPQVFGITATVRF